MKQLAPGLSELELKIPMEGIPPNSLNVWLAGDVVIDSAVRPFAGLVLAELEGQTVSALSLTHGHMDHQGGAPAICDALSIPLFCPELEAEYVESGDILPLVPDNPRNREDIATYGGPAHPVSRRLKEGDEVGGFIVLDTPGHSPGHISYWRESDRVLIVGDAISNMHAETFEVGLMEPLEQFTLDPARNRESIRRLAALDPALACFGHGPSIADPDALHAFAESLSAEVAS